jgi:hypothetical protein
MSTAPRGMSVQEGYRLYREQAIFVNRRYQRKLVWTEAEKARLIESILNGFPIPLILLAERSRTGGPANYEVIDGLQRMNAIFSFIENAFSVGGRYFDVNEFARAKQIAEAGTFSVAPTAQPRLPREECANFLDYQLAVTIYTPSDEEQITDVFGRINSGGKQLSDQEKRQAGLISPFAMLVRRVAAEIRGDASKEVLPLADMPEISIDSRRARQNYGLTAEDTFWCKQGVLRNSQLRDSEDEEMLADIAASILLAEPLARSREVLDDLYTADSEMFKKVENALSVYSGDRLANEIKVTFSVLRETVEAYNSAANTLRATVNPGSANPIKAAFYAIFMSFFDLVVKSQRSPSDAGAIMQALKNLHADMITTAHYTKTEDRIKNVDKTTGLIQRYFVEREPPALKHGPGLALDFENSLRRSSIETARYEFKQGLLRLAEGRAYDTELVQRILETICAIANVGPESPGFIYIGVADKEEDARRIEQLDAISSVKIGQRFVVGIGREVIVLKSKVENYVQRLVGALRAADLSEPLKTQVLSHLDIVDYRGYTVIRLQIPSQREVSFLGNQAFTRINSQTTKVEGKGLLALNSAFRGRT